MPQTAGRKWAWVVWVIVLFIFCRLASRFVPTVEGVWFDSLLLLGLAMYTLLLVHGLTFASAFWGSTRDLLKAIAKLPLQRAFARVPDRVTAAYGPYLSSGRPGATQYLPDREKQQQLIRDEYKKIFWYFETEFPEEVLPPFEAPQDGPPVSQSDTEEARLNVLADTSRKCVARLALFWKKLSLRETFEDPRVPKPSDDGPPRGTGNEAVDRWVGLAEDFVALEAVNYLSQFFIQLRNQVYFAAFGPLLLLLAVTTYPLHPQYLWLMLAGALIVAAAIMLIRIFVQIERNEVVSWVSKSTPNRLEFNWSFIGNLVLYVAPVLLVLASTSPNVSDLIHSWFDPLFQVFQ